MNFIEKDLEDLIWSYCNSESGLEILASRGLKIPTRTYRQFDLGRYGRVDLLGVEVSRFCDTVEISFDLIELKRDALNISHIQQICRYKSGLARMLENNKSNHRFIPNIRATLIVSYVDTTSDLVFITNNLDIDILAYQFSLEKGLVFNKLGRRWGYDCELPNTGFKDWSIDNYLPEWEEPTTTKNLLREIINYKPINW